ncbi:hypothetical protein ACFLXC_04695, partial [Chloroflexota bacterium]
MDIFTGNQADNFEKAAALALRAGGISKLSQEVITTFIPVVDPDKLKPQAERNINGTIHQCYGRRASWHGKQWFVPLPQPAYDRQTIPRLAFKVQTYLVAAGKVDDGDLI